MKLYHARPADRLVFCVGRRWTLAEDPSGETAGYAYIDIGRTRFILHNPTPEDLQHCISLHVWQCYLYAAAGFTANAGEPTRISWRRIATDTGLKVQKAETHGDAAAKKEEKRIEKVLSRFRDRFKRYGLGVLKRMAIIKDTASSTREIPILSADSTAVYGGMVIALNGDFRSVINPGPGAVIAQVTPQYLKLHTAQRSKNPQFIGRLYAVGWAVMISCQIPKNIAKGTAGRFSLAKLIELCGLPALESAEVKRHGVRDRVLDVVDTVINALTDAGFMIAVADAPAKSAEGGTGTQQADDDADELAEEIAGVDKDKIAKTVRGFIACGIVPPKPRKPKKERRRKETKKPLTKKVPTDSESSAN